MGRSHVLLGGVVWLALGASVASTVDPAMSKQQLAVGTLVSAGAALLPDLDHPDATIAHTLGPISRVVARGVSTVAGGHRQATHSVAFALLGTVATLALLQVSWGAAAVVFVCAALALRAVGPVRAGAGGAIVAAVLTAWIVRVVPLGWWLALAVGLGALCHVLADALTPEGVPLAWPIRWRLALPLVSRTGNAAEGVVASAGLVGLIWLSWVSFGPAVIHGLGR